MKKFALSLLSAGVGLSALTLAPFFAYAQIGGKITPPKLNAQKKKPGSGSSASGKSGTEIVLEMARVYQNAKSFQDRSEAKMTQLNGTQYIQSNLIRFSKPNMIVIESRDPQAGTFTTYASGTSVTVFSGKQNVFMRTESPPDLPGTLKRISQTVLDTMGVDSSQVLSPFSFALAKNGLPDEASELKLEGTDTIDGHKVYKISGKASQRWFQKMVPPGKPIKIIPDQREVFLWIDMQSHLLVRAAATFSFHTILPKSGNQPARRLSDGIAFTETHTSTQINPTFAASDFTFKESKNVKQIFPQFRPKD